jgi:hypothetical protein
MRVEFMKIARMAGACETLRRRQPGGQCSAVPHHGRRDARIVGHRERLQAAARLAHHRNLRRVQLVVEGLDDSPFCLIAQLNRAGRRRLALREQRVAQRGDRGNSNTILDKLVLVSIIVLSLRWRGITCIDEEAVLELAYDSMKTFEIVVQSERHRKWGQRRRLDLA